MPATYRYERDLLIETIVGAPTIDDIRQNMYRALDDPQSTEGIPLLIDARQGTSNYSSEELQRRTVLLKELCTRIAPRVAIVVSTSLQFGLARMYSIYASLEGLMIVVFTDFEMAREWLLDPSVAEKLESSASNDFESEKAGEGLERIQPSLDFYW